MYNQHVGNIHVSEIKLTGNGFSKVLLMQKLISTDTDEHNRNVTVADQEYFRSTGVFPTVKPSPWPALQSIEEPVFRCVRGCG